MDNIAEQLVSPREIKVFIDRKLTAPLAEMGLTPSEGLFIREIGRSEGISLKTLSEQMCVDKALTTRRISALIDRGFVQNTSTGHEYSLSLTDNGHTALLCINEELQRVWNDMLGDLTEGELDAFKSANRKIAKVIREESE